MTSVKRLGIFCLESLGVGLLGRKAPELPSPLPDP